MALSAGTRLGPYEILAPLGVGGMGEVYRARDTKLNRDVALKVLPDAFTLDPDRLARFKREAQILASLNHPHIGHIYGLEDSTGVPALVLELIEGPTLADRIAQGAMLLDEALPIARQIAEALEAAHEQGIIHRDLKPANIKVLPDGTVKVLDFGLAKEAAGSSADRSQSPTLTAVGRTHHEVILGTAAYMSPEQARGGPVDTRTDIWAFGCVVYEMWAGHPPFVGATTADMFAAILEREPQWDRLPNATPDAVRRLLRRCLAKDRAQRLRDVGDARFELDDAAVGAVIGRASYPEGRRRRVAAALVSTVALLAVGVASAFLGLALRKQAPSRPGVTRTAIVLPPDQELDVDLRAAPLAISPDGTRLAYVLAGDGRKQLYLRKLSDLAAISMPGTVGAAQPFFSPDGNWVAFFARGLLQKVAVQGGAPLPICPVAGVTTGGSWGNGDTIVFATLDAGLSTVAAAGGAPQPLPGGADGAWPEMLPDGRTVLFTARQPTSDATTIVAVRLSGNGRRVLASTDAPGRDPTVASLGTGQMGPVHFVPTGHLVFGHGAFRMRAMAFDPDALVVKSAPVPLIDTVFRSADGGPLYFAVSNTGVLVYLPEDPRRRLVWVDREAQVTRIGDDQEAFRYPRVSPDGKHIAVDVNTEERRSDIWIYDAERGTKIRLTSARSSLFPVWTPDAARVTFSRGAIVDQPYQGSGPEQILIPEGDYQRYPTSWSPDGREFLFTADHPKTGLDLWVWSRAAGGAPRPLLVRPFHDAWAKFSPDGQWIAYVSDESGTDELYAAHYPDLDSRVIVSTHGASWAPVWSPNGHELFYRQGSAVMAVTVDTVPTLRVGIPHPLFTGPYMGVDGDRTFDVSADGRRFLLTERVDASVSRQLVVVQNWFEELTQRAPVTK